MFNKIKTYLKAEWKLIIKDLFFIDVDKIKKFCLYFTSEKGNLLRYTVWSVAVFITGFGFMFHTILTKI